MSTQIHLDVTLNMNPGFAQNIQENVAFICH